jgi:peptidylprolyl isomerase
MKLTAVLAAVAVFFAAPAIAADWRPLDPENGLVIDTTKGRIIVEMVPEVAPASVARIKELTRTGFYDGLTFHRVIGDFMAQTGDPLGTGAGGSQLPDVPAEFGFKRGPKSPFVLQAQLGSTEVGVIKSLPVITQSEDLMMMKADGTVDGYGLFCPGVAGMARASSPDSANSQFFLMRQVNTNLDRKYTPFGRVVSGLDVVRRLQVGEPPASPDKMLKVRILADIPAGERPTVQLLDPKGGAFKALMKKNDIANSFDHAICAVDMPVQVTGGS